MATQVYCDYLAVRQRVADGLHVAVSGLPPEWDSLCSQATKDASAEIKKTFILKGFTAAQVAQSDDIKAWCERLAAFLTFCRGTALCSYDLKSVEYLDCRKEMAESGALLIGDIAVSPASTEVGGIAYGTVTALEEIICEADRRGLFR